MAKRRALTTVRAVRRIEQWLGVRLRRTSGNLFLAVLPEGHPVAVKAKSRRLLLAIREVR